MLESNILRNLGGFPKGHTTGPRGTFFYYDQQAFLLVRAAPPLISSERCSPPSFKPLIVLR